MLQLCFAAEQGESSIGSEHLTLNAEPDVPINHFTYKVEPLCQ